MKPLRIHHISALVHELPTLKREQPPRPFPGKRAPTRVAWRIELELGARNVERVREDRNGEPEIYFDRAPGKRKILEYLGKPSRYRALEALKFLQTPGAQIRTFWQAEFDRGGLVAYHDRRGPMTRSTAGWAAYHPHAGGVDPIQAFSKPVFLKRIGGLTVYSHQKRLSVEQIDKFYAWYESVFRRCLKRPKQTPAIGGSSDVRRDDATEV